MDARLQILGARIERQFGREPAEKRTDVGSFRRVEAGNEILKALRAEGNPDSPDEGLARSIDWDLDTTADEKQFVVDHAGVGLQDAPLSSLLLRDPVEIQWGIAGEGWHRFVPLIAGRAFETKHWVPRRASFQQPLNPSVNPATNLRPALS
jgi:hypothetical protein